MENKEIKIDDNDLYYKGYCIELNSGINTEEPINVVLYNHEEMHFNTIEEVIKYIDSLDK